MSIRWVIIERLSEVSTIALNVFFLYRTMNTKVNIEMQVIAVILFIIMRMTYFYIGFGYHPYFTAILSIIFSLIVFEGEFKTHTVWSVLAVVINGIVDAFIAGIFLQFPSIALTGVLGIQRTMVVIFAKLLLFIAYCTTTKKVNKNSTINTFDCISLIAVSIGCLVLLEFLFKHISYHSSYETRPMLVVGSFSLLLILISTNIFFSRITANGSEIAHLKQDLNACQITQEHKEQSNALNMNFVNIRHDLFNHFCAISGYLSAKDYTALEIYVANLTNINMDIFEYVNHPVLNALIRTRVAIAAKEDIVFTTSIMLPKNLPISDFDLCIIVSNILDNAFEANRKTFDSHFIHFSAQPLDAYWIIACRNSVCDKGDFRSNGSLKSTKESGQHGIGTRQIKAIAEKTGGFVTFRQKDYEFSTLVMLKLDEA